jgi:hypothetical protein
LVAGAAGVDNHLRSLFAVAEPQSAYCGQGVFQRVTDAHGSHVVPSCGEQQGTLVLLIEEIADEKDDGPTALHALKVVEGSAEAGSRVAGVSGREYRRSDG